MGPAGGLPGPPSRPRLGSWHLAPGTTLLAWHCGLLLGGRPPFPVAGVVSLSQCGGVGVWGGHLPGVQAGPVREFIPASRQLRWGEACSGSSPPHPWELGNPGGALAASARHHPDKLFKVYSSIPIEIHISDNFFYVSVSHLMTQELSHGLSQLTGAYLPITIGVKLSESIS